EMVGDKAGQWQQQQRRTELQGHDDADGGGIPVGQFGENQPVLCRALHPGADVGDKRTRSPEAEIETTQRAEYGGHAVSIRVQAKPLAGHCRFTHSTRPRACACRGSPMPNIDELLAIMARLRDPDNGCPWDIEQSFETIVPYTIEEAYEVADAVDRRTYTDLRDELGDLLLQVVFHARMAEEAGHFRFEDVVAAICRKMVSRHPHVFAEATAETAEEVLGNWEAIKRGEREAAGDADRSALAGIARGLPEWQRATKLQKRAARVGFDWPDVDPVFDKLHEEIDEVRAEFA